MSNSGPRAIVVAHGDLAAGLVSAVAQITGRGDVFVTISNRDMGAEELERRLREELERTGASVVFTDLPAGSCATCARRALRARDGVVIVAGANLAMLLDFVFHEEISPADAALQAAERGRAAVTTSGAPRGA